MISDTPGRGGEGGQKRANFCGRPLWMAPYRYGDEIPNRESFDVRKFPAGNEAHSRVRTCGVTPCIRHSCRQFPTVRFQDITGRAVRIILQDRNIRQVFVFVMFSISGLKSSLLLKIVSF